MTESYVSRPMTEYVNDAAAGIPAPGGGSVSAMTGALAMTMAEMALNFTVGKKKFADVENECRQLLATIGGCRKRCLELVDEDVRAYGAVAGAYGLPRGTDGEKATRTAAIQSALVVAMGPPLETFRCIARALAAIRRCVDVANPNLISDVGVSAVLARSALLGARLNVEINLAFLKDEELIGSVRTEIEAGTEEGICLADETHRLVSSRVSGGGQGG